MSEEQAMLAFNAEKVRQNVERATTEDLLDRATVYREGMEPEALDIIEQELRRRGVTTADMNEHARRHPESLSNEGFPARCRFCPRPAVSRGWGWHRLFGLLPLFPRPFWYCTEHQPGRAGVVPPEPDRRAPETGLPATPDARVRPLPLE